MSPPFYLSAQGAEGTNGLFLFVGHTQNKDGILIGRDGGGAVNVSHTNKQKIENEGKGGRGW